MPRGLDSSTGEVTRTVAMDAPKNRGDRRDCAWIRKGGGGMIGGAR